ncbi:MAG: hypothetical protein DLM64_03230 [Solirubrobacterales bacterium]|nr:MAG: hypothetical protein DLM64_03230 [Solirubrobacterales bacterium]
MSSPVERVLIALDAAGLDYCRNGDGWMAQCSGHDDRTPSLSIKEGDYGKAVLHCFANCTLEHILAPLNLTAADLHFVAAGRSGTAPRGSSNGPTARGHSGESKRTAPPKQLPGNAELTRWREALQNNTDALGVALERKGWSAAALDALAVGWDGERFTIPITGARGELVNVCRYMPGGKPKMFVVARRPRDLFPAPESFPEGTDVWLVEGEPDAISGATLGLHVIAVPGTSWAKKASRAAARFAHLRRVHVLTDCDPPGRDSAGQIAACLAPAGPEVRLIDLASGRSDGRDLGDEVRDASLSGPEGFRQLRELLERVAAAADVLPSSTAESLPEAPPSVERATPAGATTASSPRPLTDLGNAERLADRQADRLRFVPELNSWYAWTGNRWGRDTDGASMRAAKLTARGIYAEVAETPGDEARKLLAEHAKRSESAARLKAMLELAQSDKRLITHTAAIDRDPYLLSCGNGTVDLRTGQLRPSSPADLITSGVALNYRPEAPSPSWLRFLDDVFAGDQELVDFMQRWAGYCLTGDTREQCFAILYGDGANGKSTLVDALKNTSGEFAAEAAFQTFAALKPHGRELREDLAALRRARMVTCSEPGGRRFLDTEVVKKITGGDEIVCREPYGQQFTYKPAFKLLLLTNHRPRIDAADEAMWRRVRLIPFEQNFRGRREDKTLSGRLKTEAEGILAWRIAGARNWHERALGSAGAIDSATGAYRESEDQVGRFLADRCELSEDARVPAAEFREVYATWCEQEGESAMQSARLGEAVARHGIKRVRPQSGYAYAGVRLS